jgi:hypothetical protein
METTQTIRSPTSGQVVARSFNIEAPKLPVDQHTIDAETFGSSKDALKIRVKPYSASDPETGAKCDGSLLLLNSTQFSWRDLDKFPELHEAMKRRKYQIHHDTNSRFKTKPTLIPFVEGELPFYTEAQDNNRIVLSVCLTVYNEEWSELSGTLRSLAKSILVHRSRTKAINEFEELHVNVVIIQDGKDKCAKSFRDAIVDEFGCPSKKWIDSQVIKGGNEAIIICPDAELHYPAHSLDLGSAFAKGL